MIERKRYASSTDVARLAGVSQSAVSRAYRPGASVSAETRRKVIEAGTALGYRPSLIPRIMLTHRSHLVAVVTGGLANPFYAAVLECFAVRLQESGYQVLLMHTDSGHSLDAVIPRLSSYRVDAIVSALAVVSAPAADALARLRIPVVLFNAAVGDARVSTVCCDNVGAGRAMAAHFAARGARRPAFVTGPDDSSASRDRLAGFRAGLAEAGLAEPVVARADYRYEGGHAAALGLFAGRDKPDALFCANDMMAMGALDALRIGLKLRVPDDVLAAGFDDVPPASWGAYDLTTAVQDAPAMVDASVDILRAAMARHDGAPGRHEQPDGSRTIVPARLVLRGSTDRHRPAEGR